MIGIHVNKYDRSIKDALHEEIVNGKKLGLNMKCAQIFVVGPKNSKEIHTNDEKKELLNYTTHNNISIIVHGSYLDNPWGKKPHGSLHIISNELKIVKEINAIGFILHLPRDSPDNVVDISKRIILKNLMNNNDNDSIARRPILYLEVGHMRPDENTYETGKKIGNLYSAIKHDEKNKGPENWSKYVGFCVDTAHLWSSGIDISSYEKAQVWIDEFKKNWKGEVTIALNDEKNQLGDPRDEHESLAHGRIWEGYKNAIKTSGLYAFLKWGISENIPMILERKGGDKIKSDIQLLSKLGMF